MLLGRGEVEAGEGRRDGGHRSGDDDSGRRKGGKEEEACLEWAGAYLYAADEGDAYKLYVRFRSGRRAAAAGGRALRSMPTCTFLAKGGVAYLADWRLAEDLQGNKWYGDGDSYTTVKTDN